MDLNLEGRRALVTGAGAGIGREIAKTFVREGVEVLAVARTSSALEFLAEEILAECGRGLSWLSRDLIEDEAPARLAQEGLDTFGPVDILVNNAGASLPAAWDTPDSQWRQGMALNFEVHRALTQALLPSMMARNWGRIINVTGSIELKHINIAASAKAALTVWNKGLAHQVGRYGITCNCIEPGLIESNQFLEMPAETKRQLASQTAFKAFGQPADIAATALFLASERAAYVTGTTMIVDGGLRQRSF